MSFSKKRVEPPPSYNAQTEKKHIIVITACGGKKHDVPMPAWMLYKSSRIKALYKRSGACDMYILSTKYGLINANKTIAPYDAILTKKRSKKFIEQIAKVIESYDYVVYFRGGARKEYVDCIKEACQRSMKTLIVFGYAFMGGINKLPDILLSLSKDQLDQISSKVDIY